MNNKRRTLEMPAFMNPTSLERSKDFDRIIEASNTALAHPSIIEKLGEKAVILQDVNESVFLPNLRGGKLTIPREYQDADAAGLLPILRSDTHLTVPEMWPHFAYPSKTRKEKFIGQIMADLEIDEAEALDELQDIIDEITVNGQKDFRRNIYDILHDDETDSDYFMAGAVLTRDGELFEESTAYYLSRPLIITEPLDASTTTGGIAATALHEYWHASKAMFADFRDDNVRKALAQEELEAYHISQACLNAYQADMSEEELSREWVSRTVDKLRLKHNHPDRPFHLSRSLRKALRAKGLLMAVWNEE